MIQLIKVRVKAGGKKNEVVRVDKETLEVEVKAKPQRGEANEAVRALVAGYYKLAIGAVRILKGRQATHKIIEVKVDRIQEKAAGSLGTRQ